MFTMILTVCGAALALAMMAGVTGYWRYGNASIRPKWLNEASVAKTEGDVIVLAVRALAVCIHDIAAGEEGTVQVSDVWNLPATAADTWTIGEQLYWNTSTNKLTNAATTHVRAGMAASKKYALATTADVWLNVNVD
jgi:predicted RecA/RadA family phage recombinase